MDSDDVDYAQAGRRGRRGGGRVGGARVEMSVPGEGGDGGRRGRPA